jgi:phage gpG-like protein
MADAILAGYRELDYELLALMQMVTPERRVIALMEGALVLERWMKFNIKKQGLIDTRNLTHQTIAQPESSRSVSVGPRNTNYAAIHEYGGIITPKRAKNLAIPLTGTAKNARSPRNFAGELHVQGKALVDASGMAQYALVKSVTIPARPYVRPALDEHGDEAISRIADRLREFAGSAA